jgi:nucleoside-diphosphate-sugar epimerase
MAYSFIIGKDKTFKNILSISYLQNSNIGTRISNLYTTLVVKGRINIFVPKILIPTFMKALFIGGTGTISTDVVALAQQRGWEITLLNRGSKKLPEGMRSIVTDIHDEQAVAKAIAHESYDVVAQFIGYTAKDVERDIRLFQYKTKQYIFISSASAYQKPQTDYRITESTPLVNPFWEYSRNKIEAEEVLMTAYRTTGFPVTIVPSHTYNGTKPPVSVHGAKGNWQILKRILDGKPVIIPGDGSSLWTLTHSKDFAKGYVGLMANPHAIGNAFHITTDESMTWNQIYETIADALGKPLNALHVASDFLAEHGETYDFRGELLGDKAATVVFDNSKIKRLVPDFICTVSMVDGLRQSVHYMLTHPESQTPDLEFDKWCDRIADAMYAADKAFKSGK